jgi:hypothetical protein
MCLKLRLLIFRSYFFTRWTVHIALTVLYCFPIICNFPLISKKGVEIEHLVQTKYGGLKVADLIGKKFGTKVCYKVGGGKVWWLSKVRNQDM